MTPAEIKAARLAAGLTQQAAAELVYVSVHAWRHWEHGIRPMPRMAWELFQIKLAAIRERA